MILFTTQEEFENEAIFLRLGLPFTLVRRSSNVQTFFKRSSNWRNLKTPALQKAFLKGAFRKRLYYDNHDMISQPQFYQTQIQNDRCLLRFKFPGIVWTGKHLMRSQSETSVFKFLRGRVNGAL